MKMNRIARLDRTEEILVVVDPEIRMVAALHQHTRPTERESLFDLLEDHRRRQQIPLAAIAGAAVEGAEVAVGDAHVRVVDVPVDDEGDACRVDAPTAQLVCGAADREQVARLEQRERLGVGDALTVERAVEYLPGVRRRSDFVHLCVDAGAHHTIAPALTNRSSGTSSSSPTSCASSRNV